MQCACCPLMLPPRSRLQSMRWRDLFDMVIVNARKPDFFNYNMSLWVWPLASTQV